MKNAHLAAIAFVAASWLSSCVQPTPPTPQAQAPATALPLAPLYPAEATVAAEKPVGKATAPPVGSNTSRWHASELRMEPLAAGDAKRLTARVTDGSVTADLHAIVFDSRRCGIRVIDQPSANAGGSVIASAMRGAGAIGGVNGGYFTPEFESLGLMIASGKPTGKFASSTLLGGVIVSTNGTLRLLWRDEYTRQAGTTDLVQAGPRLVDAHRALGKLDRQKTRPRTFIATDGRDHWAIGTVKSVTLGDLAELLAAPGILADFHISRALNLDGGRSTAIWMRTASGEEISDPGWSTVRNFIAIVPRS